MLIGVPMTQKVFNKHKLFLAITIINYLGWFVTNRYLININYISLNFLKM